jgi:hypothetical protein
MNPERIIIVEAITLKNGLLLKPWTYVWKLGKEQGSFITIEYRDQVYQIPEQYAVQIPVATPSKDHLCSLDPCFLDLRKNLIEIYRSESFYFSIFRCAHDNYFMEDIRGGIAMYSRWIFLGKINDLSPGNLKSLWSRYHNIPSDALFHMGIGC